ncbi:MAG: hypothetical protein AMJ54_10770 [Deltaproteobacteria bacterium SG8_13]|nr:MAG: hypothetical protein AMJ54_10770 [Deltaproteobacteria bacterium SG8_13]
MIVICEDCGRKYRIDPERIKGQTAKFKCKACNHIISVTKPEPKPAKTASPPFIEADGEIEQPQAAAAQQPKRPEDQKTRSLRIPSSLRTGRIGLGAKMMLLFCVLPILLFAASGWMFFRQMDQLSELLTSESKRIVSKMAEEKMADIARATAMQVKLFLLTQPGLRKENFERNLNFKRLAVQKVGMTGYTALYELPGPDGVWRTWSHPNGKIIGIDMSKLKKPLGVNFPGFWKVYTGVRNGGESKGYYTWQDKDGKFRDKFMVCTPIDGTPFVIAATTYLDELTLDLTKLTSRSAELTAGTRSTVSIILAVTLLLIALVVSFYGYRLAARIKALTNVADRISIGELDADIPAGSNDEIGELGEAIARMQDSIRLSIERLRRRR